jgi:DNA-binding HxlR family transcriptional regulator
MGTLTWNEEVCRTVHRREGQVPQVPPPKRHPYNQWSPDARALDLVGDKWTLLIVRDLAAGPRRFVELQRVLPGISTEQLRSRLNRMVADGMLTRQRFREVPPRVDYELTERARELLPVLGELARWGYEWSWSSPRENELVDIGAIIRLAPGLVHPAPKLAGSVELLVTDAGRDGGEVPYLVTVARGMATLAERADANAAAHVTGTEQAWIRAFAPDGSRDGLKITGDKVLAGSVLNGLAHTDAATQAAAAA